MKNLLLLGTTNYGIELKESDKRKFKELSHKFKVHVVTYGYKDELIHHDFVRFEEELINKNIKKSNQNKYSRLVKSSELLMKMLAKIKNDFYRSSNSKYTKKEKELIVGIDKYVEKLMLQILSHIFLVLL